MIIHTVSGMTPDDPRIHQIVAKARDLGLNPEVQPLPGTESTPLVILLKNGDTAASAIPEHVFQSLPGVAQVVRVSPALVSLTAGHNERRVIQIGGEDFGGSNPCRIVLGPCTIYNGVEREIKALAEYGVKHIRGGAWKPRSRPEAFRGHGDKGLGWALEAARDHNIGSFWTEVIESCDVETLKRLRDQSRFAGDIVPWVGARNLGNYRLLESLGTQQDFPVMLKHSLRMRNLEEFLAAAEFVLHGPMHWDDNGKLDHSHDGNKVAGNDRLILCVRGLEKSDACDPHRFAPNFYLIDRLRERTWAVVNLDPAHMAGELSLVFKDTREGLPHHPDSLMIETILNPSLALCDKDQAVPIERVPELLEILREHNATR